MSLRRFLLGVPWLIVGLSVPLGAYWMLEGSPVELEYVHPKFVSRPVGDREQAAAAEIDAARGGTTIYRYIEYTVNRPYTAKVARAWMNTAMVWNAPDFSSSLTRTEGRHRSSVAVETPTSSPTREMNFVQKLTIPVNWLRTIEYEYPPIPLRILSPQDADALGCETTCRQ